MHAIKPANICKQDTSILLADKLNSLCGSTQVIIPDMLHFVLSKLHSPLCWTMQSARCNEVIRRLVTKSVLLCFVETYALPYADVIVPFGCGRDRIT